MSFKTELLALLEKYNVTLRNTVEGDTYAIYDEGIEINYTEDGIQRKVTLEGYHYSLRDIKEALGE